MITCCVRMDGMRSLLGQFANGSYVAILRCRVHSEYCQKDYYIPVSILYPISKVETDTVRIFLIVSKSGQCVFELTSRHNGKQGVQLREREQRDYYGRNQHLEVGSSSDDL